MIAQAIRAAHTIGICGHAPSDFPEFAEWLVEQGIDSISLNPDTAIKTALRGWRSGATYLDLSAHEVIMKTTMTHPNLPDPVQIPVDGEAIFGDLQLPDRAQGLVLFVHGSGSSRFSSRNRFVAEQLNHFGLGTLLVDLLTREEQEIDDQTMQLRFDIPLLARCSMLAVQWAMEQPKLKQMPIGLFGASTGAAAALITAATLQGKIAAVVSRGGRPDLAGGRAPTGGSSNPPYCGQQRSYRPGPE